MLQKKRCRLCTWTGGFIVLFSWAIFKRANNDHKAKTQYDERQNAIRGRGYMFGFWTVLGFLTILFVLECVGVTLPVAPFSLGFVGVEVMLIALGAAFVARRFADKNDEAEG